MCVLRDGLDVKHRYGRMIMKLSKSGMSTIIPFRFKIAFVFIPNPLSFVLLCVVFNYASERVNNNLYFI